MDGKATGGLTWTLWTFAFVPAALTLILSAFNMAEDNQFTVSEPAFVGMASTFTVTGALIVGRHRRHIVGWIFYAAGLLFVLSSLTTQYGTFAVQSHGSAWPLGPEVAGLSSVGAAAFAIMAGPLLLLFPTGRLVTERLKPVLALGWAGAVLTTISEMLVVERLDAQLDQVANPYRIDGAVGLIEAVASVSFGFVMLAGIAGAASLVHRFRRTRGAERQQVKWMAYAGALFMSFWIATISNEEAGLVNQGILDVLFLVPVAALPAAAAIAILRHNLYDIDRIISRTLAYAVLSAGLGATYLGLVVGLQQLLDPVSGGSDLAIVATTLVVAALFLPARRRVQRVVDRRFNRRTYDAQRTIEAFSARLREQIDLDTLRYELLAVVEETMQPSTASLWLRTGNAR